MSTLNLFVNDVVGKFGNDVVGKYWYYTGAHEDTIWKCVGISQDKKGVLCYEFSSPKRPKNKKVRVNIFEEHRAKNFWQERNDFDDIRPKYPSPSPKTCNIL
jgi:hypothetical protein